MEQEDYYYSFNLFYDKDWIRQDNPIPPRDIISALPFELKNKFLRLLDESKTKIYYADIIRCETLRGLILKKRLSTNLMKLDIISSKESCEHYNYKPGEMDPRMTNEPIIVTERGVQHQLIIKWNYFTLHKINTVIIEE